MLSLSLQVQRGMVLLCFTNFEILTLFARCKTRCECQCKMGFSAPGSVTLPGAHVDEKLAKSKGPPWRAPLSPMLNAMGYYTLGQKLIFSGGILKSVTVSRQPRPDSCSACLCESNEVWFCYVSPILKF